MTKTLRIQETDSDDVDAVDAVIFSAKGYPWTARILADVPVYVLVGHTGETEATDEDFYINEFDPHLLAVGACEDVSILGTDTGTVWVSEVRCSS